MQKLIFFVFIFFSTGVSFADEIRPAYLEVTESSLNEFTLLLKQSSKSQIPITLMMPKGCSTSLPLSTHLLNGAVLQNWGIKCEKGLFTNVLEFEGLSESKTDILVRLEFINGTSQSVLLTPNTPEFLIPEVASSWQIVKTYTYLGVTHILMGFDHLLFVFALLLIVKNISRLLWTITAFTLAHSLTMAGATLGIINIPQAPVEAIIALSIMFLSMELIHEKQGKVGLTSRYPWIIAFIFGLLHGFGFAGALAEIGLPQQAIILALVFFNIGVELGQLLFVASIVFLYLGLRKFVKKRVIKSSETLIVYIIGALSAFWFIQRVSSF